MSLALLLLVLALATFRLTRLVTQDDFPPIWHARNWVQHARPSVTRRSVESDGTELQHFTFWWLGELVSCPWCASAYISAALVFITWLLVGMPLPVLCWLAVWGLGALVADRSSN